MTHGLDDEKGMHLIKYLHNWTKAQLRIDMLDFRSRSQMARNSWE